MAADTLSVRPATCGAVLETVRSGLIQKPIERATGDDSAQAQKVVAQSHTINDTPVTESWGRIETERRDLAPRPDRKQHPGA